MAYRLSFVSSCLLHECKPIFSRQESVMDIAESNAILISLGSLIIGWFIYDLLCKSPLVDNGQCLG